MNDMGRVRRLEAAVIGLVNALRQHQDCPCSLRERESGHKFGCDKPYRDEALQKIIDDLTQVE
jgi:hypothetical protein